ncbi:hypothetical protein GLN3_11955 [Geobacillus lituanicus]|nr:hypothetical protein GLN3_11955 [Geobacillus lituanicus]
MSYATHDTTGYAFHSMYNRMKSESIKFFYQVHLFLEVFLPVRISFRQRVGRPGPRKPFSMQELS